MGACFELDSGETVLRSEVDPALSQQSSALRHELTPLQHFRFVRFVSGNKNRGNCSLMCTRFFCPPPPRYSPAPPSKLARQQKHSPSLRQCLRHVTGSSVFQSRLRRCMNVSCQRGSSATPFVVVTILLVLYGICTLVCNIKGRA
jgi:hypothetical protein